MLPHLMFEGGCHCGKVRFRVTTERRDVLHCNCSMCTKKALVHLIVSSSELTIVQGEEALQEYKFGTGVARHLFCQHCGIHPFYVPRSHPDGYSVNLRCLDEYHSLVEQFEHREFAGADWEANIDTIR